MKEYLTSIEIEQGDSMVSYSFKTREEAQAWCDNWNSQIAEEEINDPESNIEKAVVIEINI